MGVLDASRSRPVMCWKRYCGFSTQVRNGTCCRKAIRTTKMCIGPFKLGAAMRFCVGVLTDVANELRDKGALDEEECFIDATFVMAKGGGSTHAANHHEVRLVQLCFDFYMIEAKPENLIGDRVYDSDPLDEELRNDGIEMIAPHCSNRRKPPTQDRRRLSRYMRRWLVERFFRLDTMATSHPRPLGVPRSELSRLCPASLPRCPLQTILR